LLIAHIYRCCSCTDVESVVGDGCTVRKSASYTLHFASLATYPAKEELTDLHMQVRTGVQALAKGIGQQQHP
jgi:hypothetical protein